MTTLKPTTKRYTIERIFKAEPYSDAYEFFLEEAKNVEQLFGYSLRSNNFDFQNYARHHCVWLCRRDDIIVGLMMAQLYGSVFDPSTKILFQDLLYVKKSSGRAAYLLMNAFLDFGRIQARMIFTALTKYTNVKGRSLERLGFTKAEQLYRMDV